MVLLVVWVVLMMFWLCFGCYWTYNREQPAGVGNTVIPWVCVLIVGLVVFGAFKGPPPGAF